MNESTNGSIYVTIYLPACLPTHLPIYPSTYLPIYLSTYLAAIMTRDLTILYMPDENQSAV